MWYETKISEQLLTFIHDLRLVVAIYANVYYYLYRTYENHAISYFIVRMEYKLPESKRSRDRDTYEKRQKTFYKNYCKSMR